MVEGVHWRVRNNNQDNLKTVNKGVWLPIIRMLACVEESLLFIFKKKIRITIYRTCDIKYKPNMGEEENLIRIKNIWNNRKYYSNRIGLSKYWNYVNILQQLKISYYKKLK